MDIVTLYHMFMGSAIGVFLIQWLKNAKWFPWAQATGTKTANRIVAIILALFGATGVHYVWDPTAHTLLLTNLTVVGIVTALWHWFSQFVTQETLYQATANRNGVTNHLSVVAPVGTVGTIAPTPQEQKVLDAQKKVKEAQEELQKAQQEQKKP